MSCLSTPQFCRSFFPGYAFSFFYNSSLVFLIPSPLFSLTWCLLQDVFVCYRHSFLCVDSNEPEAFAQLHSSSGLFLPFFSSSLGILCCHYPSLPATVTQAAGHPASYRTRLFVFAIVSANNRRLDTFISCRTIYDRVSGCLKISVSSFMVWEGPWPFSYYFFNATKNFLVALSLLYTSQAMWKFISTVSTCPCGQKSSRTFASTRGIFCWYPDHVAIEMVNTFL